MCNIRFWKGEVIWHFLQEKKNLKIYDVWYIKVLVNGILYLYMCPLTDVACGVKWGVGMSTKPCTIRYIIMTLYWALRSCSGAQFSSFSIGVTLVVCLKSLYTNRADRLCTASSLFMLSLVWGSQIVQAYSMSGLTNVW